MPSACDRLTQSGKPAGDGSIDLIHDDDDHQVDDGGGGLDRGSDVGARCGVGAHVQSRLDGDPVQDDPEYYGKSHTDLQRRRRRRRRRPNF